MEYNVENPDTFQSRKWTYTSNISRRLPILQQMKADFITTHNTPIVKTEIHAKRLLLNNHIIAITTIAIILILFIVVMYFTG